MSTTAHRTLRIPSLLLKVTVVLMVLLSAGCMIPRHRVAVNETPECVAQAVTKHFPASLYRLSPGDLLEFLYLAIPTVTHKPYRLSVGDRIDIEFAFHPEMNRTVTVRPDGGISIPRRDDVKVAGMTASQVKSKLTKVYSDLLRDPEITVTVRDYNVRLTEIQRAVSTAGTGQGREIRIRPDGHVSLPLIADMPAAGMTVPTLTSEVNKRYRDLLGEIKVSVLLREISGNVVFVDGQVRNPGVFTMQQPLTVQQVIALAGGTTPEAEPRTVLVVSRGPGGRFLTRTTNLEDLSSKTDYHLVNGDLVYVPRSRISRANIWVDQNIRNLLMFDGWSLGLSTDLGRSTSR